MSTCKMLIQVSALMLFSMAVVARSSAQQPPQPILPENSVTKVSDHVYAIMGWPNIGIVVGTRGTLVIDTGMGVRNGTTVLHEAQKLAKGPVLYLTTTHYHAEHAAGAEAFPANTVLIRNTVQQEEMDQHGEDFMNMFRGRSPQFKELLEGVKLRPADILFDHEMKLDLGGVTVRLFYVGPAHTKGDELIFVETDSVLLPGDIVENKLPPMMPSPDSSVKGWLANLEAVEPLHPRYVVPDHGQLGDGSLIGKERAFLLDLQSRALELKHQGVSVDDAAKQIPGEFKTKYPEYDNIGIVGNAVRRVYTESQ